MIDIKRRLQKLTENKTKWRSLDDVKKISYIDHTIQQLPHVKEKWVELCAVHKNIDPNSHTIGQEWLFGPVVVMCALRLLKSSLLSYAAPKMNKIVINKDGQYVANVIPNNFYESILFYPINAEILIQKNKLPTQKNIYHSLKNTTGSLCVILGAGNVSSISILDLINQLFVHQNVCLLKLSPINDYLFEIFVTIFKPLIEDGFVDIIKGNKEIGEYLCSHELTDTIHLTGSTQTYQSISKFNKKITAELGCVTPVILTPGEWSQKDMCFHAKQIASAIENNASFNCNAMKVLLVDDEWTQKEDFLNILRNELSRLPLRHAYYPDSEKRYCEFLKRYPQSEMFGYGVDRNIKNNWSVENFKDKNNDMLPWILIPNVEVHEDEYALNHEAFCGVLAVVGIKNTASNPSKFLNEAVRVCNHHIFGTLSCTLLVDPKTHKNFNFEIEEAIKKLEYGSIGVNCWAAISYFLCATVWGAYPNVSKDFGYGFINNFYFFDHPEKSIIRSKFRSFIKPIWFYDNKKMVRISKKLFNFEYSKNLKNFIILLLSLI